MIRAQASRPASFHLWPVRPAPPFSPSNHPCRRCLRNQPQSMPTGHESSRLWGVATQPCAAKDPVCSNPMHPGNALLEVLTPRRRMRFRCAISRTAGLVKRQAVPPPVKKKGVPGLALFHNHSTCSGRESTKTSHRYCGNARVPVSQRTVSRVSCRTEFSGDRQSASQTHPLSHGLQNIQQLCHPPSRCAQGFRLQ